VIIAGTCEVTATLPTAVQRQRARLPVSGPRQHRFSAPGHREKAISGEEQK
jgi:hypothetical protein